MPRTTQLSQLNSLNLYQENHVHPPQIPPLHSHALFLPSVALSVARVL